MKKPFVASVTMMVVATLGAAMLTGLAPSASLSASASTRLQTAAARAAFVKDMSSHALMMRATGPAAQLASSPVSELGSYNWSGFADVQNTGTGPGTTPTNAVSGSWTIPAVNCLNGKYQNQDAFLAQWVGLDGFTSGTVEQLGTATQCYEGVEYYYVWYEMFPNGTIEEGTQACINNNVKCPNPGDSVTASVVSTPDKDGTDNDYLLKLTDYSNQKESFAVSATCPSDTCVNSSAEWVVERPAFSLGDSFQILPQAYYGQTSFSNGTQGTGKQSTSIDNYAGSVYDIAMIDDSAGYFLSCPGQNSPPGQLLLVPVAPTDPPGCPSTNARHGNFSDTWDSSF